MCLVLNYNVEGAHTFYILPTNETHEAMDEAIKRLPELVVATKEEELERVHVGLPVLNVSTETSLKPALQVRMNDHEIMFLRTAKVRCTDDCAECNHGRHLALTAHFQWRRIFLR
jgi:hypothetical protein